MHPSIEGDHPDVLIPLAVAHPPLHPSYSYVFCLQKETPDHTIIRQ